MAGAGNTVTLTFAGDDRNLSRVLAGLTGKLSSSEQSVKRFGAATAVAIPAVGYAAGAVTALSGVLGLLPSMAFAGALGLGALAIGTMGFGDALSSMDDPAKFAEALRKLSPAAAETAIAIRDLKPQFDGLRASVQQQLFTGIAGELRLLSGALLPTLNTQLGLAAASFNRTALSFMGWLRMPSTVTDINTALGGSQAFLDGLLRALLPVSKAFLDMGVVAAPYMRQLGDAIASGAQKFGEFIARARESGQLATWIEAGKQAFLSIWETIKNLVSTVVDLGIAFGPGLLGALQLVSGVLASVAGFIRENSAVMVPLIAAIAGFVVVVKGILVAVSIFNALKTAFVAVTAVTWLFNAALWANPITWVVLAIVALIAAIVLCIVYWDEIKAAAVGAIDWIVARWNMGVALLSAAWALIKSVALSIWNAVTSFIAQKVAQAIAFIHNLSQIPGKVAAWFGQMKDRAIALLASLVAWVASLPGRVLAGLAALGQLAARAAAWFGGMVRAGIAKGAELAGWMAGLPGRILSALGHLGGLLVGAGRSLIQGFISGIRGMIGSVISTVSGMMSSVRSFFPFSPAKVGPFSGRGYTTFSGEALTGDFGKGIITGAEEARKAAQAAAAATAKPFNTAALDGVRVGLETRPGAAAGGSTVVNLHVNGSILSERELIGLIRDEFDRGGFRGVRGTR